MPWNESRHTRLQLSFSPLSKSRPTTPPPQAGPDPALPSPPQRRPRRSIRRSPHHLSPARQPARQPARPSAKSCRANTTESLAPLFPDPRSTTVAFPRCPRCQFSVVASSPKMVPRDGGPTRRGPQRNGGTTFTHSSIPFSIPTLSFQHLTLHFTIHRSALHSSPLLYVLVKYDPRTTARPSCSYVPLWSRRSDRGQQQSYN